MARRIRSLDDDAIRATLKQEDESDEEIGSEENDDEERVVNKSDHSTDYILAVTNRKILIGLLILKAQMKTMKTIIFAKIK